MNGSSYGHKARLGRRLALACMAWGLTVAAVAGAAPASAAPFSGYAAGHARVRAVARQPARPAKPSVLMPCTPPRPAFNGGTGAFHSDHFLSDYVTAPTFGAADVPNANFTNVYLWPNLSKSWDTYTGPLGAPPSEVIDTNTQRLACSSYFDLLTQYNINPPSFSGDENTVQTCVNGVLANAALHKGVISWLGMGLFARCIHDMNPNNRSDQINIFLSPDLKASSFLHDGQDMCTHSASGYHGGFAGNPSWTVIATSPGCGKGLANIMKIESHEMVELMSDTAGFGWKHDAGFDFEQTYDNGELGDICSGVGEYPTSPANFPADAAGGPFVVAPYWSDQDSQCEPQFIMNDTIVPMFSTPPFSFGGSSTTVTVPVSQNNDGVIQALELDVATGTNDLSGNDRLMVTVHTTDGDLLPLPPINEGTQWGSGTLHAVLLPNAVGVQVSHITAITLTERDGPWDLAGVELQAAIVPPGPCITPRRTVIDDQHETIQDDGKPAIMRMKGGGKPKELTVGVTMLPPADAGLKLTGLDLVIGTGGDNLDGGRDPQDNANVIIHLASGLDVFIPNVNKTLEWPSTSDLSDPTSNPSPTIDLLSRASLPPSTVAGDVKSITIETEFPGGLSGENWDINLVQLAMSFGCARTGPPPKLINTTLLNLDGNNTLPDGSTGLCRETGSNMSTHPCLENIPPVPAFETNDIVTDLRMTIVTGQDDLRCCNAPGNNADVVINSTNPASPMTYSNMNESQHLDNGVSFSFPLFQWTDPMHDPLPDPAGSSPLTLGQLQSVEVKTNFGGAQNDNWDIKKIVLTATVADGGCCSRTVGFSPQVADLVKIATVMAPDIPSLWAVKNSPNQPGVDNALNGVSCVAPTRCMAVGGYGSVGTTTAMIETWNGSAWSIAATPSLGSPFSTLTGVSCRASNNCLAVGFSAAGGSEGGIFQPLAEAWNGAKWKLVSPPASKENAVFKGVSCPAISRCVAVGYRDNTDVAQTLVETWNAGKWKVVATPNRLGNNALEGVSCWAVDKCMAVGGSLQAEVERTLALKANSGPWHIVSTPNLDKKDNVLYATSCVGTGKCFAVGDYQLATATNAPLTRQTLVEAWNGSKWSVSSSPSPGVQGNVLDGIACTSATNCVGSGSTFGGSVQRVLVLNWNGKKWKKASTPDPSSTANVLFGVSCPTQRDCDAVGTFTNGSGAGRTLVLRGS